MMNMTRFQLIPAGASLLLLLAAPSFGQNAYSTSGSTQPESASTQTNSNMSSTHHAKKTIDMAEVPQAAKDSAQQQLGTAPERAKEFKGSHPMEYELSAKNGSGKNVRVDVFADGTLARKGSSSHNNNAG